MFFVLSTGRSGSKAISPAISKVPGHICLHEPYPQLIIESSAYRYGELDEKTIATVVRKTRSPMKDGKIYCESNQTLALLIPVLAAAFPAARYIWLIRNGLDFVASSYAKQWYSGHSENHSRYEDCPPLEKAWIDGRIQGDLCGDMSSKQWNSLDRFAKCCWYWSYINRVIQQDLYKWAPGGFFRLRLEEIESGLYRLFEWMGCERQENIRVESNNAAKAIPEHWSRWSPQKREMFETWCGPTMDHHYPGWRACYGEIARLLIAPAFRNMESRLLKLREISGQMERIRQIVDAQEKKLEEQRAQLREQRHVIERQNAKLQERHDRMRQIVDAQEKKLEEQRAQLREQRHVIERQNAKLQERHDR